MIKQCIYNELYTISNDGKVYSIGKKERGGKITFRNKEIKPFDDGNGYLRVDITTNGKRKTYKIHRLVAEHFIDNTLCKPQVNHIDGNKYNNNVNNLEWVTAKENIIHSVNNDLFVSGMFNKKGKLHFSSKEILQKDLNDNIINTFESICIASKQTNINRTNISLCVNNKRKTAGGFIWQKA